MNDLTQRGPLGQKVKPFVSVTWRESARGQNCTLMLDGCRNDTETTVLCHLRFFAKIGLGASMDSKPHDFLAVYGCAHCHHLLDLNHGAWGFDDVLFALGRTLTKHYEEGRIK